MHIDWLPSKLEELQELLSCLASSSWDQVNVLSFFYIYKLQQIVLKKRGITANQIIMIALVIIDLTKRLLPKLRAKHNIIFF